MAWMARTICLLFAVLGLTIIPVNAPGGWGVQMVPTLGVQVTFAHVVATSEGRAAYSATLALQGANIRLRHDEARWLSCFRAGCAQQKVTHSYDTAPPRRSATWRLMAPLGPPVTWAPRWLAPCGSRAADVPIPSPPLVHYGHYAGDKTTAPIARARTSPARHERQPPAFGFLAKSRVDITRAHATHPRSRSNSRLGAGAPNSGAQARGVLDCPRPTAHHDTSRSSLLQTHEGRAL